MNEVSLKNRKIEILFTSMIFYLYVLMTVLANHTIYYQIISIILIVVSLCGMVTRKKAYNSIFFLLFILFIIYSYFQILFGITVYSSLAGEKVQTLIFNLIFFYFFYNYIIFEYSIDRILKLYVYAVFTSVLITSLFSLNTILEGRFLSHINSILILGVPVNYNANAIGTASAVSFCFSIIIWNRKYNIKRMLFALFFLCIILLTGSRKSLGIVTVGMLYAFKIKHPKAKFSLLFVGTFILLLIYYVIMKIPVLYNIIGIRIESVMDVILNNSAGDSSISTRANMIKDGIYFFSLKPWLGHGLANFLPVTESYSYSHNNYIELLVNSGIIGITVHYFSKLYILVKTIFVEQNTYLKKLLIFIMVSYLAIDWWTVSYFKREDWLIFLIALAYVKINENRLKKVRLNK